MIKSQRDSARYITGGALLLSFSLMTSQSPAVAQVASGCGAGVLEDTLDVGSRTTPLLQSFFLEFSKSDHHIRRVSVEQLPGDKVSVGFHDRNLDDEYCYDIRIVQLFSPGAPVFRAEDTCDGGSCSRPILKPDGDVAFVLINFNFSFPEGIDHHIDEIAIFENQGEVFVSFNDRNNDDLFDWSIKYAYVPMERIREIGETRGVGDRRFARRTMPGGITVIRGFRLNFEPGPTPGEDHHLKTVGVEGRFDGQIISVFYADRNGDDAFDWEVRWAILDR